MPSSSPTPISRRTFHRLLGAGLYSMAWGTVFAQAPNPSGSAVLKHFLSQVQTGRCQFTQNVLGKDGQIRSSSKGQFSFARPQQFKFSYQKPYAQTIISDGKTLWMYDEDLAQATQRSAAQALASTPVALLAGQGLERAFVLKDLPLRDGQTWVQASPKDEAASVKVLRLGFANNRISTLEIDDAMGQKSVILFENFESNPKLDTQTFQFTPPKGVDVIKA